MASTMLTEMPAENNELDTTLRCANDPNFAVVCDFLQKFANDLGIDLPNFKKLQEWITKTDEVAPSLREMQIKLLRKTRKTVHEKSWESALSKFCFSYSAQDAWEIERFGYKNASMKVKLRILRELLECQFERNSKFRAIILARSADSLRSKPIGRDRLGHAYWVTQDNDCNLRIYQEHLDEEIWQVVATNRDEFVNLIERLRGNEVVLPSTDIGVVDEDTSSSNSGTASALKVPPPEEKDDSEDIEQKVPKLSIKLKTSKGSIEIDTKDVGKGEEELAAEEDAVLKKDAKDIENCDEEFEEIEEEYEDESDEKDAEIKPLPIVKNNTTTSPTKKRTKEHADNYQDNSPQFKKSRPSLLDSKRSKSDMKHKDSNKNGEENYEDSTDIDDDLEEIDEEDIDSAAAEEDENEEKHIEDFDDDDDDINGEDTVGQEITDPVLHVQGEGSGKECESFIALYNIIDCLDENEDRAFVSDIIEEKVFLVIGEGCGNDCMVGNIKDDDSSTPNLRDHAIDKDAKNSLPTMEKIETKTCSSIPSQSDCLNMNASKNNSKNEIPAQKSAENISAPKKCPEDMKLIEDQPKRCKNMENESIETNEQNVSKSFASDNVEEKNSNDKNAHNSKKDVSESKNVMASDGDGASCGQKDTQVEKETVLGKIEQSEADLKESEICTLKSIKKERKVSKQNMANNQTVSSNLVAWNRKRRLEDFTAQQSLRPQNSESEIDLNSENTEELSKEHEIDGEEQDVGGKRLKMRSKQNHSELRKKVEALKAAANDETTSSSGDEEELRRRKKVISPKKHGEANFNMAGTDAAIDDLKTSKVNDEHKKTSIESSSLVAASIAAQKPSTSSLLQGATVKNKPTLEDIIETKLKKPQEQICKSSSRSPDENSANLLLSPPKKCPVTKPLKKTLLTQIRQEEIENEVIPRKQTVSEDHSSSAFSDCATPNRKEPNDNVKITSDHSRVTPDRQRKRRSSEEVTPNNFPEEPESKKEVICKNLKEEQNECSLAKSTPIATVLEKGTKSQIKTEHKTDEHSSGAGRRSGRHAAVTTVTSEISQVKRTRGCPKSIQNAVINEGDFKAKSEKTNSDTMPSTETKLKVKEEHIKEKPLNFSGTKEVSNIESSKVTKVTAKGSRKQRDVDATNIIEATDAETPVRQSRRIAQQKIREEAERRKLEEIALRTMKQELKKKKKAEQQVDPTVEPPSEPSTESDVSDLETKRKVQKKKCPGKNGSWSSGSEEPDDEEEEEHPHYESDHGSPLFKSDHEFSPESDIEDETHAVPMKRARTARKENATDDEQDEEEACQKCNKSDHPEWILLCDKCDKGYHCSCLSPVLFYIPEGDWYCPPCQQEQLIKALECQLNEFDNLVEHKKLEEKEKRLAEEEKTRQEENDKRTQNDIKHKKKTAEVDSSEENNSQVSDESNDDLLRNSDDSDDNKQKKSITKKTTSSSKHKNDKRSRFDRRQASIRCNRNRSQRGLSRTEADSMHQRNSESASKSSSPSSSSFSDSDNEPIYKLRKRRQINVSYRLNEFDDLINSALKKEMDEAAGAGNLGRGKDISTIIEADKEEKARQKHLEDGDVKEDPTPTPKTTDEKGEEMSSSKKTDNGEEDNPNFADTDSDDEPIKMKSCPKPTLKKKSRKLTTLDISSEDDGSDEDFKGSSLDDDEEDTSISASSNSDSSLEVYKRKNKSKKKQRKAARRAFRQRRKDRKFVVDESDDDEDIQKPKSKKKRKDDSDYTETEVDDDDVSELSENIDSADLCDDSTTDASDGAWRPNKRKKSKKSNVSTTVEAVIEKEKPIKKSKKLEYSDDDVSESEDSEENEDDEIGVGGGKQPRSQPLKQSSNTSKTKNKAKSISSSTKIKKKKKASEDELSLSDSGDSTRRTRGRRYAYLEDFDDDSSDGGIKPGVQRPDTPPEEREKFIKRQEEIKRMLAEKNAEGAKLAATPRLTPIKSEGESDKRSPPKPGADSLSTVPLSVIRQAKVLDIDYLQRRGESLDDLSNDVGDVDDEFDDADLPDDLPEDMDEDAIARMVEEEEDFGAVAVRELPQPDEVLRTASATAKPKSKETERATLTTQNMPYPTQTIPTTTVAVSSSGLQEPVRKRLPMPTIHPPLLRHQMLVHDTLPVGHHLHHHVSQRHLAPPASHLLQNALSAPPQTQSMHRMYAPPPAPGSHHLINRMTHNLPVPSAGSHIVGATKPTDSVFAKSGTHVSLQLQDKSVIPNTEPDAKPRGRRKKITPLRDTLQKQQTAQAVARAAAASIKASNPASSAPSSVIKVSSPIKGQTQTSVITSFPPTGQSISSRSAGTIPPTIYAGSDGFYGPAARHSTSNTQRHRVPPQIPPNILTSHPAMRPSYGPPPLKGSHSVQNTLQSTGNPINVRTPLHHLPPYVGGPPTARHSPSHLNLYGSTIYGNPNFSPRGNLRPPLIHSSEYSTGSRAYPPYGFYPPPPPLTTPPTHAQRAQVHLPQHPTSVIVANTIPPTSVAESLVNTAAIIKQEVSIKPSLSKLPVSHPQTVKASAEVQKKLTTLEACTSKSTPIKSDLPPATDTMLSSQTSPGFRPNAIGDSAPIVRPDNTSPSNENPPGNDNHATEFSGLVSYFSSQHDDYNT